MFLSYVVDYERRSVKLNVMESKLQRTQDTQWDVDPIDDDWDEEIEPARKKFAEFKANRGFWPIVAVPADGSISKGKSSFRPKGKEKIFWKR